MALGRDDFIAMRGIGMGYLGASGSIALLQLLTHWTTETAIGMVALLGALVAAVAIALEQRRDHGSQS